ncbi:probable glycosyltransferase STELLO1 [Haliotis rufescens]|uniref:probable glycosyltransferase STELLO1 n=1 Tax=Haliotis rufescens TaxID=6454 RepID=UPI00201EF83E|nr:probable glycosyltransferase STELLO1 [Haliotis rufescens]
MRFVSWRVLGFLNTLAVCVCLLFAYIAWPGGLQRSKITIDNRNFSSRQIDKFSTVQSDRWIVVTTISYPTPDIKFLANIPGWKVVVVGDTKTPADWRNQNCVFLSLEDQRGLGFDTESLLPEESYARKTMGYLFAIAHGAKVIYETDDDNRPLDLLKTFKLDPTMWGILYRGEKLFNPYRHFGQPTLWPRGYPLGSVGESPTTEYLLNHWKTPSIQQGLVNGDPDMDAIFRLTRKQTRSQLNVTFDGRAPPAIVPAGVFAPFNSQNTLFLYDALWALLIPSTTTFRVCDIWRGYWAQRLLWEMGGNVGFFPPNAVQRRNSHSYLSDAQEEKDLYFQTERLVDFLTKWKCGANRTFFACMTKLSTDMVHENFWKERDASLTSLWIKDLVALGYKEPKRIPFGSLKYAAQYITVEKLQTQTRMTDQQINVKFWAAGQTPPQIYSQATQSPAVVSHAAQIASYCSGESFIASKLTDIITYPNILLIVVFNFPHYENLQFLETMYSMHFPHIIYCEANKDQFDTHAKLLLKPLTFIEVDHANGWLGQLCLIEAMKMQFRVDGYLYMGDDVLLNVWNIHMFPLNKLWVYHVRVVRQSRKEHGNRVHHPKVGSQAYQAALKALKIVDIHRYNSFTDMLSNNSREKDGFYIGSSDICYVPEKYKDDYLYYMEHFSRFDLYIEVIFPTVPRGIEKLENLYMMKGTYCGYEPIADIPKHFNERNLFVHTVKISKSVYVPEGRTFFCKYFFPLTLKNSRFKMP